MMKTKGVAFVLGMMSLGVAGLAQAETISAAGGTAIFPSCPNGWKLTNRKPASW